MTTSGVISSVCFTGVSGSDLGGVTFGFAFGAVSHARSVKRNNVGDITFGRSGNRDWFKIDKTLVARRCGVKESESGYHCLIYQVRTQIPMVQFHTDGK